MSLVQTSNSRRIESNSKRRASTNIYAFCFWSSSYAAPKPLLFNGSQVLISGICLVGMRTFLKINTSAETQTIHWRKVCFQGGFMVNRLHSPRLISNMVRTSFSLFAQFSHQVWEAAQAAKFRFYYSKALTRKSCTSRPDFQCAFGASAFTNTAQSKQTKLTSVHLWKDLQGVFPIVPNVRCCISC